MKKESSLMRFTVAELFDLIDKEYNFIEENKKANKESGKKYDTNSSKKRVAIEYLEKLILTLPNNVIFSDVKPRADVSNARAEYGFIFPNVGDVAELALAWHTYPKDKKPSELSVSRLAEDMRIGIVAYDCKASFSATCMSTPFYEKTIKINGKNQSVCVLLINQTGIYRIGKNEREQIRNSGDNKEKEGRYKWAKEYDNHATDYEEMIGWLE